MAEIKRQKDWFRLDNSAKIFPEVSNEVDSNIFRVQIALTEEVEPEILQLATLGILDRYPMFQVKLRHGFFWNFFDRNDLPFVIQPMTHEINAYIHPRDNNKYLFKVLYRNNLIAIEMFHSLADGAGVMELLKSLVFEYLRLKGYKVTPDNIVKTKDQRPMIEEYEDANVKYYDPNNRKNVPEKRAYKIKGTTIPENLKGVISGTLNTKAVIDLARSKGLTMTQYFSALAMYCIYTTQIRYRGHLKSNQMPVKIFVPVNLRKFFPSDTLRNFANFVKTEMVMTDDNITLDELFVLAKKQFEEGMTRKELIRKMSENVAFEKNVFLKFTPYFIKRYALKIGYNILGMKLNTMSLTNIGRAVFPKSCEPYIYDATAIVNSGTYNTVNCAIMSYNEKLKITFSRSILETNFEKEFFKHFTDLGLEVKIESNYVEEFI